MDAQSIYGIDQMTIIRNPSYVERSVISARTDVTPKSSTLPITPKGSRFERSISHVLQRSISQSNDASPPSPSLNKPKLRWFESASNDTVNLGSSVDMFLEDGKGVSVKQEKINRGILQRGFSQTSELSLPSPSVNRPQLHFFEDIKSVRSNGPKEVFSEDGRRLKTVSESNVSSDKLSAPESEPVNPKHQKSVCTWLVDFFDLTLFHDLVYVNIMLGMSLAVFAELNFAILTPFIFNDLAYTTPQIASFLSLLAIADIASRFVAPFVGDRIRQPPRTMYMISLVMLICARMS